MSDTFKEWGVALIIALVAILVGVLLSAFLTFVLGLFIVFPFTAFNVAKVYLVAVAIKVVQILLK